MFVVFDSFLDLQLIMLPFLILNIPECVCCSFFPDKYL